MPNAGEERNALQIVKTWQAAANAHDRERLLELSDPEIEIVGPRGVARGHEVLGAWLERAGLTARTKRGFVRGDTVVLAQHGVWRSVATGDLQGEADLATSFRVVGGRVTQISRYEKLEDAFGQTRLSEVNTYDASSSGLGAA